MGQIDRSQPKRYDLVTNYRCGSSIEEMEPADEGEWVRWEEVAEVRAEVVRLRAVRKDGWKQMDVARFQRRNGSMRLSIYTSGNHYNHISQNSQHGAI